MKNKILQEFLNSDLKIKSQEKLNQYIDYCLKNNKEQILKGETSHHHILPKANSCFPEFANLKENPWNGTHLLYSDHYYAHWLLTEAIEDYGQLSAFCKMHNCDIKLGRVDEKDLISAEEFQKKMKEKTSKLKKWYNENPEKVKELSGKISKTRLDSVWKETIGIKATENMLKTRRIKDDNGKDSYDRMIDKVQNKVDENGLTSLQRGGIQSRKIMKIIDKNGLSGYQRAGKKLSETLDKKARIFDVYDANDNLVHKHILEKDVRKISQKLPLCTKDFPLGNTPQAKKRYINNNKSHLIGLYSVKIKDNNENI